MGGKNNAPPPPDYTPVAAASERSAELSFRLGQEQLAWAREQYAGDREILDRVVNAAMERQTINDAAADRDRQRYEQIYQPLEEQAVQDAQEFASPERQAFEMGRAQANVADQFEMARRSAMQNLESFGVDPSSTRFAALDLGSRVQEAAAQAGAGNQARAQTEAMGRAMRSEAINVGRGYPGQIAGTYGTALQSGNSAANTQLAGTASGASTMGTAPQYMATGNQAIGQWGNTLNMGYNNQMAQFNANQQSSSGIGSLLGAGLGVAANSGFAFEQGGAIPDPSQVTPGGKVPTTASPTRGAAIDDVDAKLTVGEFVVPKDVAAWKGEEFFQKLIMQSRKSKEAAPAKPQRAMTPPNPATFRSSPAMAIPMG